MLRQSFLVLLMVSGCASDPDSRPATFQVVSQEVLAPSCGAVQCHSTTTRLRGFAFDTLEDSRAALIDMNVKRSPTRNDLDDVLSDRSMPPDVPINDQDMALIHQWMNAGAPGL